MATGMLQSGMEVRKSALDSLRTYAAADAKQKVETDMAQQQNEQAQHQQNQSMGMAAGALVGAMTPLGPVGMILGGVIGGLFGGLF